MNIATRHLYLLLPLLLNTGICAAGAPGRLFFTPEERTALERQRQVSPTLNPGNTLTINGEIRHSTGRSIRWINGEDTGTDASRLPSLPVGNTYHPATGEHEDLLGDGRIIITPGNAKK